MIERFSGGLRLSGLSDWDRLVWLAKLSSCSLAVEGNAVRVERSQAGFSVEPPATATAAEALDSIRESFPYVGWAIVGETVVVLREAPLPRER